jgi:hypothetical protein
MAYPKTITFSGSENRAIVNALPGGRFSAIDPDQPQEGEPLIWGIGDTEMAAIADLERRLREAE